eukprot:CAMPEP_0183430966 /NCGR_PEP_ID=MMETSP0370-20130417/54373_1 /TAXON_ID=268820 /ORGANISM="Peridinium aciculiferum, Strain PAER-2" /LENGTH=59 /DNA_ID=CAMNT_0025616515 /DNA_START=59 /DNA_END=238 /DNA_ORIENTATION=-
MTATSTTATATTTTTASATATPTTSSLRGSESSGSTKLSATFVRLLSAIIACSGLCIGL